jgi:threonine aldolase
MSCGVRIYRTLLRPTNQSRIFITQSVSHTFQKMAISTTSLPPPRPTSTKLLQLPEVVPPLAKNATQIALTTASRDFRSDTITAPTQSMGLAMAHAAGGDNVYNDDLTTNAFEASVAALLGKEAGLFVPSGTMSNQLCLRTWLMQPPFSIVCDQRGHIHQYEAGGCAFHSGAAVEPVIPSNGLYLTWKDIESRIVPDDDNTHHAPTRIVSLENTINGVIVPQEEIIKIADNLRRLYPDIKLHLDGARIWHVAVKTGLSLEELCRPFDSVSVCFSKGLGAPVGR